MVKHGKPLFKSVKTAVSLLVTTKYKIANRSLSASEYSPGTEPPNLNLKVNHQFNNKTINFLVKVMLF